MSRTRFVKLNIDNGGTYAANATMRVAFNQLAGYTKPGDKGEHSLIAGYVVTASFILANATGGAVVPEHEKLHDIFRKVTLGSGEHYYLNFQQYGGQALRLLRILQGRNNELRADAASIANGASSPSLRLTYFIPFSSPSARKPGDFYTPARSLKDDLLEMVWANGAASGEFGAGLSVSSGSVDEVTAVIVDEDHFRAPPKWSIFDRTLKSTTDSSSLPGGLKYRGLTLFPAQSPSGGYASTPLTTTDISKLDYFEDDAQLVRDSKPQQLVSQWNADQVMDDSVELPQFQANGANPFLPIKYASIRRREGLTKGSQASGNPVFNISGSLSTTGQAAQLLCETLAPTTEDWLVHLLRRAGINPSKDMLANVGKEKYSKVDSADKVANVREDKKLWLPRKWIPQGRK